MQGGLTQLLWSLGGAGAVFLSMRLLRIAVWLLLRPGGWAVLVVGLLVAVKAMDGGALPPVVATLPERAGPLLPERAEQPPPMRP